MKHQHNHKINFTQISDLEKKTLKNRVLKSARTSNRLSWFRRLGSIAAFLSIATAAGWYYYSSLSSSSILEFAKYSADLEVNSNEVVLILSDDKKVKINEDEPHIKYSKNGQIVNFGATEINDQNTQQQDKLVFNTLFVPYGKRSQIELSDGTMVWLNSGSKLIYPAAFSEAKREVYLEGEGIFEVTHDSERPFWVVTVDHQIEVLGTSFYVSNYSDEGFVNTVLKSGSVQVSYSGTTNQKLKITPGTLSNYNKMSNQLQTMDVDVDRYFAWRNGVLMLKKDNLKYIMRKLSRYYNVSIEVDDEKLSMETFSGHLDLKEDLLDVFGTINQATPFEYEKTGNNYLIIY